MGPQLESILEGKRKFREICGNGRNIGQYDLVEVTSQNGSGVIKAEGIIDYDLGMRRPIHIYTSYEVINGNIALSPKNRIIVHFSSFRSVRRIKKYKNIINQS